MSQELFSFNRILGSLGSLFLVLGILSFFGIFFISFFFIPEENSTDSFLTMFFSLFVLSIFFCTIGGLCLGLMLQAKVSNNKSDQLEAINATSSPILTKYCLSCGSPVLFNDKLCLNCGNNLNE